MKKSLWVMAILLAIGMVLVGCPQVNGPGNPTNGLPENVGENPFKGNTYKNDETEYVFTEKEVTYKTNYGFAYLCEYHYNTETKLLALKASKMQIPGSEDWMTLEQYFGELLKEEGIYPTEQETRTAMEQAKGSMTDDQWNYYLTGLKSDLGLLATATWTEVYDVAYNYMKAMMGPGSIYYSYDISGSTLTLKDYVNPGLTLKQYYKDYLIPSFSCSDEESRTEVYVGKGWITLSTNSDYWDDEIVDVTDTVIKTKKREIPYTMTPGVSPELKVTIEGEEYTLSLIPSVEVLKRLDDSGSPSNGDSGSPSNGDSGSPSNGDSGSPSNGLPENVGENPFKGNTYKNDEAEYVFTEKEVNYKIKAEAESVVNGLYKYHYNTETKLLALIVSKIQYPGYDWMTVEQYFGEVLKGLGIYPTEQESRTAAEQAKGSMTDEEWRNYKLTGLKSKWDFPATATWTEVYDAAYNYAKAMMEPWLIQPYSYDISGSTLTLKDYVNPELTLKQYYKDYSIPSFSYNDEESHTVVHVSKGLITLPLPTSSGAWDVRITDVTDTVIKTNEVEISYTMTPGVSPELKVTIGGEEYTLSLSGEVETFQKQ